jgi:hypothetical protein
MYRSSTMGRRRGSILILVGLLQVALGAGFVLARVAPDNPGLVMLEWDRV